MDGDTENLDLVINGAYMIKKCSICGGTGSINDAEPGDTSFKTYPCPVCDIIREIKSDNPELMFVHERNCDIVAVTGFLFTYAIITGVTRDGYENRYCYHNIESAVVALMEDWEDEPTGWHRALYASGPIKKRCENCGTVYHDNDYHRC